MSQFEFEQLIVDFQDHLARLPDHRTGKNKQYEIKDAVLGAFGCFFTQTPSFLAYQRDLERRQGRSNAHSLFGVEHIPCDNQIRQLLDPLEPGLLGGQFEQIFEQFEQSGLADRFMGLGGEWLIGLDGTQHFSSTRIHCENCHQTKQADDQIRYSHQVLTPVLVGPTHNQVLPFTPEFMQPQADHDRQDCEREAVKRWLRRYGPYFEERGVTLLGDDLYANQPLCQLALKEHFNVIFVCKPTSHPHLYQWLAGLERWEEGLSTLTERRWNGRYHERWHYRYVNQVPIRAGEDALLLNWAEITITRCDTDEQLYHCAFVTNHPLTDQTIKPVIRAGRARWKVENEHNNVLKTKGYHLEHNFGHGQQHLANFLLTLNLLAFLFHTLFALFDDQYQQLRQELGPRATFFNDIRALTRYFIFDSWHSLLTFMLDRLYDAIPPPSSPSG